MHSVDPFPEDPRLQAFCSRLLPELFHGVEHTADVWRRDPFDVPGIHANARSVFFRIVEQSLGTDRTTGRLLLLQGEPGAGKTHLMRTFRNKVHQDETGLFAYMQMTSTSRNYERYILQKVVESLEQPYDSPIGPHATLRGDTRSSLVLLSNALADRLPGGHDEVKQQLLDAESLEEVAHRLTDALVDELDADPDLIRSLLLLQVGRPSITRRVVKFLRAEALSDYDRSLLGGMAAREEEEAPMLMLDQLRELIRRCMGRSLVICADQLEDIYNLEEAGERFSTAMTILKSLAEMPGTVVVVSCLEEFYVHLRASLSRSVVERLEQDPAPMVLIGERNPDEVTLLVEQRLRQLYLEAGVDNPEPLFPFVPAQMHLYAGQTTRNVLNDCLRFREAAYEVQRVPDMQEVFDLIEEGPPAITELQAPVRRVQQNWNDDKSRPHAVPEDEDELLRLLCVSIEACAAEFGPFVTFEVQPVSDEHIRVVGRGFEEDPPPLLVALCEADPQGGSLAAQIDRARLSAGSDRCILVRSASFPVDPATMASQRVSAVLDDGGRAVVVTDTDWRHMVALQQFQRKHAADVGLYRAFLRAETPLRRLASLRRILTLDRLRLPAEDAPPRPPDTEELQMIR